MLAPGPRGDFLLGSTLDFKERPLQYVQYLAQAYGDVVRFRIGFSDWFLVSHPDLVLQVLVSDANKYHKPQLAKRLWKPFLGEGVLAVDGERWKRAHKLIRPGFHRERVDAYGRVMVEYTERMLASWEPGSTRDISVDMVRLTLEIVAKTLFDTDVHKDAATVGEAMLILQDVMTEHIHLPIPLPRWWPSEANKRKVKALDDIHGIIDRVIAERRADDVDRGDLLSMLVQTRTEEGDALDDAQIRDEAMTLFFAGHETTSNALTWNWFLLARNPEVTARCVEELDRVVGDRPVGIADLRGLTYLDAVVKESMRILPSVWSFMREPIEDVELGGFPIEKGANIMISPWVLQHDPRWFPAPYAFRPERFLGDEIHKGAYVPFSAGPRVCAGKAFATMEARLVLATMLQKQVPTVPADFEPELLAELSLHPGQGLPIDVEPR